MYHREILNVREHITMLISSAPLCRSVLSHQWQLQLAASANLVNPGVSESFCKEDSSHKWFNSQHHLYSIAIGLLHPNIQEYAHELHVLVLINYNVAHICSLFRIQPLPANGVQNGDDSKEQLAVVCSQPSWSTRKVDNRILENHYTWFAKLISVKLVVLHIQMWVNDLAA